MRILNKPKRLSFFMRWPGVGKLCLKINAIKHLIFKKQYSGWARQFYIATNYGTNA
jgi:hypothetical protein